MRNSDKVCQKTQAIMKNTQIKQFTHKMCFLVNLHCFEWCYMNKIDNWKSFSICKAQNLAKYSVIIYQYQYDYFFNYDS